MTLWVSGAVTIVATAILLTVASLLYNMLEGEVKDRMNESIDWTTKILDQRMTRIECATKTLAAVACDYIEDTREDEVDSMLCRMIKGMDCIDLASLVKDNGANRERTVFYAFRDGISGKMDEAQLPYKNAKLNEDKNWNASFNKGEPYWSGLYSPTNNADSCYLCFSTPVYDSEHHRRGILCSQILSQWLTDIIVRYRTREDINVAIYSLGGQCLVPPDASIDSLSKDDIIQEERQIDGLRWRLVFTADRKTIEQKTNSALLSIALIMLLLVFTMIGTIVLTVRYVARPFVIKQQHTAEAKSAMQRELDIAASTQRELVPHTFPPFPDRKDIDVHACLHPARQVGGDLYDYFINGDELYFCIGDVSGKGAPASLFMAATHYLFRSVAASMPMEKAVCQINLSLCTDNTQCMFVTFWFGRLDLNTGELQYVNAGHNAPILSHEGKTSYMPESVNMPLGVWEEEEYKAQSISLAPGDTLLLYTDGVTEAMNEEKELFGDDAALAAFSQKKSETSERIINHITECVNNHAEGTEQSDDITMLCIKIK